MRASFAPRFLTRLRVVGLEYEHEDARVEHVLAVSRLFVALTSLAAWLLHLGDIAAHYRVGLVLLLGYVVASLGLLIWLQMDGEPSRSFVLSAQVNDVGWPALLCLLADATQHNFFPAFSFCSDCSSVSLGFCGDHGHGGYQRDAITFSGHHGGIWTIDATRLVVCAGRALTNADALCLPVNGRFVARILAETEKQLRAEIAFTNHLLSLTRVGSRFTNVLQNVLSELGRVFQGSGVYEIAAQRSSGRTFRWEIPAQGNSPIRVREVAPAEKAFETDAGLSAHILHATHRFQRSLFHYCAG